jgi:hypothetical protein
MAGGGLTLCLLLLMDQCLFVSTYVCKFKSPKGILIIKETINTSMTKDVARRAKGSFFY